MLKFQCVNDLCNKAGGEIVDCMMKVIGIKFMKLDGKVTHTQYGKNWFRLLFDLSCISLHDEDVPLLRIII